MKKLIASGRCLRLARRLAADEARSSRCRTPNFVVLLAFMLFVGILI